MSKQPTRYFPIGSSALTAEFGSEISEPLNRLAIAVAGQISLSGFPGFIEAAPAYASVSVFYDAIAVGRAHPDAETAFDAVCRIVETAVKTAAVDNTIDPEPIEIEVDFGPQAALDLAEVAARSSCSPTEVISIFTRRTYRVYMLGFLPGFAYMGDVDDRIAMPRRDSPRKTVPQGSVGIAGRQTGIYSLASPGGWQIIGRTETATFRPDRESPCLFKPGDRVRFVEAK